MPPRGPLTVPTAATLPSSLRLPSSHSSVSRPLSRLSRPSLLSLVREWLRTKNQATCGPVLGDAGLDESSIYGSVQTLEELREIYDELRERKGGKREVLDRVLEGDWRNGLSLRQLAMVDVQHLLDHPNSLRWTALKLVKAPAAADDAGRKRSSPDGDEGGDADAELPRLHGLTYLTNLQREVGPLMKTHYHLTHLSTLPITLLRIYVHDSPYNNQASLAASGVLEASKTLFVAFPDNAPFVYVSFGAAAGGSQADGKGVRKLVIDALPKAFSRPKERYVFKTTSLTARSLSALVATRGSGINNAASGGWGMFADGSIEQSPLVPSGGDGDQVQTEDAGSEEVGSEEVTLTLPGLSKRAGDADVDLNQGSHAHKRRKVIAQRRFGNSGISGDRKGIERLNIRMEDAYSSATTQIRGDVDSPTGPAAVLPILPRKGRRSTLSLLEDDSIRDDNDKVRSESGGWTPQVQLTFHGTHVFAGIRSLVEAGVIDGEKMPGWMTGEEGVSVGVVRDGRIRGHKGAGV